MDNVIQFPSKMVRDRAAMEEYLKDIFAKSPMDSKSQEEMIKRLLAVSKKFYREFSCNISFPVSSSVTDSEIEDIKSAIDAGLQDFHKVLNGHFQFMIREMWTYEFRLYLNELGL